MPNEITNSDDGSHPRQKNSPEHGNFQNGVKTPQKYTPVPQNEPKVTKVVGLREKKDKKMEEDWEWVPPDGSWGWLVLFGSTLVNILVPGTVKSFGVLFVEFLEVFEASPAAAAWIPALCYFLYSSLGPLSSILSVKYSYRTVTLLGGTFAASGMIISFFASSVTYLYISYGVLVGTGAGLAFPPTVYIVTSYFVRLRGLANGLCISGSAFGSIILPPLLRLLLEVYGYRGAVLIMGGLTLNVWVAALFYDPVSKHLKKVPKKTENDVENEEDFVPDCLLVNKPRFMISSEDNSCSINQLNDHYPFMDSGDSGENSFVRSASSAAVQNYKGAQSGHPERKISVPTSRGELARVRSGASRLQFMGSSTLHAVPEVANDMGDSQNYLPSSKRPRSAAPRRNFSTSSFQYVSTPYHGSTLTLQPEIFASSFSLRTNTTKKDDEDLDSTKTRKCRFFDISLLTDPLYLVILISNSTNAISYTNFIILLPSYAQTLGYDKNKGALLLSIVSAFDLVGRIGGSALSDISKFPKHYYFVAGLFFSGVSLAILPFMSSYAFVGCFCASFGLASGVYVGITAVIMADMLGTERLESSYGISLFVNGILQLAGPPLCGVWFEIIKTYVPIFFTLGLVLLGGSLIWVVVPFLKRDEDPEMDSP